MKVILLQKVRKLGELGSEVVVRKGYGRNYLIPQGIAVPANKQNLADFNAKRAEFEHAAKQELEAARNRADKLLDTEITLAARAGDEGRLFGSVTALEIKAALNELGLVVDKHEIRLPEAIRQVGEYKIELQLHHDVSTHINLTVSAEK